MVTLVVVENLEGPRSALRALWAPAHLALELDAAGPGAARLTWAARRTAIFRTMTGAPAPNDAGMDFCTLPKVMAPYLGRQAEGQ